MTAPHPRYVEPTTTTTPLAEVTGDHIAAYESARAESRKYTGTSSGPGRPRRYAPEVAAERKRIMARRATAAHNRAEAALKRLYPEDYRVFLALAKAEVAAESGPLPGDEE